MSNNEGRPAGPMARRGERIYGLSGPLLAVSGALLAMVLVYFAYDYTLVRTAPCEAIFRQTSIGLSTKISFLKAEGQVSIGQEHLIELGERAQMAALNLKTCCMVLDAGRLNPEQFLQCKEKARSYDTKLEEISELVERASPDTRAGPSEGERDVDGSSGTAEIPSSETKVRIAKSVEAARDISQNFNREIVEVRKAQALETLKLETPKERSVSAQESEPNNDGLNTNAIPLEEWIAASIGEPKDADLFAFKTPTNYRDWMVIEVDNRSTTLEPRLELFNADKASLGGHHSTTPGSNLDYRFVSDPATRYLVRISNYYGETTGAYLLRVRADKAYDELEPNDSLLQAHSILVDKQIEASIMDGKDHDFFRVEVPHGALEMQVTLVNASTSLRPRIDIYGDDKAHLTHKYNTTPGADLTLPLALKQEKGFRVEISDYFGDAAGAYRLTVTFSK